MPRRSDGGRDDFDDPILTFLQSVWQLEHALEKASKRMEDALGVSGPQRFAVRIIGVNPGVTSGQLAAMLHLHPSTVTGIVQRLEARKLVRRVSSQTDGRVAHLHLTRAGERINAPAARGTVERAARLTLSRCSAHQRRAAADLLQQFAHALTWPESSRSPARWRPARAAIATNGRNRALTGAPARPAASR